MEPMEHSKTKKMKLGQSHQIVSLCSNPLVLPEILSCVFPYLATGDLRGARAVSKFWNSTTKPLIKQREQTVHLYGAKEVRRHLAYLQGENSTEFRTWNITYDVSIKFSYKFEEILQCVATIVEISGRPNCVKVLSIYGDYFFRVDLYRGLTPALMSLIDMLAPGLQKLTINDNTLSNNEADIAPFAELVVAILRKTTLTHLIFDHSVVWPEGAMHPLYDTIMLEIRDIDWSKMRHLDVCLTRSNAFDTLHSVQFPKPNLRHFKLCVVTEMSVGITFILINSPRLTTLELEYHNILNTSKTLPTYAFGSMAPRLREYSTVYRMNKQDFHLTPNLTQAPFCPFYSAHRCLRVNFVAAINFDPGTFGIGSRNCVKTLDMILDEECAKTLNGEDLATVEQRLREFVGACPLVRKIRIIIASLAFAPNIFVDMLLSAFAQLKDRNVCVLEIQNYHQDFLADLTTDGSNDFRSVLSDLRKLTIRPIDPKMMNEINKYNLKAQRGACRLDLDRLLPFLLNIRTIKMPIRFGFSWVPKYTILLQTRDKELKKIHDDFPDVNIKFL